MSLRLQTRILETIAYSDQFEYPLTRAEVVTRLVQKPGEAATSRAAVREQLAYLVESGQLHQDQNYYFLPGRKNNVSLRQEREKRALRHFSTVELQAAQMVSLVPTVRAIAVTGSAALYCPRKGDDLDLMIIVRPGTVWVTRLFVVLIVSVLGRRRFWWEDDSWLDAPSNNDRGTKKRGLDTHANFVMRIIQSFFQQKEIKWCLNLWLSEKSLAVARPKRSYYTAYEVMQARFLYDVGGVEEAFLFQNRWVKSVLPLYYQARKKKRVVQATLFQKVLIESVFFLFRPVFFLIDVVSYLSQRIYMSQHMSREIVTRRGAYFHPRPTKSLVTVGWKKSLTSWAQFLTTRDLKNTVKKKKTSNVLTNHYLSKNNL